MNRRTLDLAIPIVYVIAIITATFFKDEMVIGAVATLGALLVGLYFAALRPRSKT